MGINMYRCFMPVGTNWETGDVTCLVKY